MVGGSRCRDSRQGGDGLHAVRSARGCPSALGAGPLPSALQDATTVCPRDGGAASWAVPRPKGSPAARSHRRAGGACSPPPGPAFPGHTPACSPEVLTRQQCAALVQQSSRCGCGTPAPCCPCSPAELHRSHTLHRFTKNTG